MRTQVGIVGAGPAGLMLAHLLHLAGVESVVLEARSRAYVEQRVRAGVLEQGTVDLLVESGVGERLLRERLVHHGIELRFDGRRHRIDLHALTGGRTISVYGQQEVVKDLIAARHAAGGPLLFEVDDVTLDGIDGDRPAVSFRHGGAAQRLECAAVAGCDGFHGVCRPAVPPGVLREYPRDYTFAWLGVLAAVAPSTEEVVYSRHERGFALHSMRSPRVSRLYLQVDATDSLEAWPDDRIWAELQVRLAADGWTLHEGPIIERAIAPLRSFVVEPMQHGRLYLAGDAAHIVPPTGAKGMNLAIADVRVLARGLVELCRGGGPALLDAYSETRLRRVWQAQQFSSWMTSMLHRLPDDGDWQGRLRLAELRYTVGSHAASTSLAERYVGLDPE
ncbi:MAG: 4-hydroxybenzoate 3-monooxygenase [Chloroflexi bacterium]|nr:MAG: 4-hydroxybenzoate 3-monooxygenase [Chloroflexota bacterium]